MEMKYSLMQTSENMHVYVLNPPGAIVVRRLLDTVKLICKHRDAIN